jgi:hypothetical protein
LALCSTIHHKQSQNALAFNFPKTEILFLMVGSTSLDITRHHSTSSSFN